jgi:hypothetical protein
LAFNTLFFFAVLSVMPVVDSSPEIVAALTPPIIAVQPLAALPVPAPPPESESESDSLCKVGTIVMIPDGREAQVTSYQDGICRVLAYGEAYASLWTDDMIEPVYPQVLLGHSFGH